MNVESYRRRAALERKRHGPGRPDNYVKSKNLASTMTRDNQPGDKPCQRQSTAASSLSRDHRLSP